jgi:CheY-like chemotaxis protein
MKSMATCRAGDSSVGALGCLTAMTKMMEFYPIVVAEDDPDDLFLLTRRIRAARVDNPLLSFSSADSAIAYLDRALQSGDERAKPCALITDLKLPPATGFGLIAWLRTQPRLSTVRVFVMSGSVDPAHRRLAEELNVDCYASKFPPAEEFRRMFSRMCAECRRHCGRMREAAPMDRPVRSDGSY